MTLSQDVRAVVTGAGSGLGRAFAVELASRGALVIASDLDAGRAEQTASEIVATGGRAFAYACDVTDLASVQRLADEAEERLGGVDLLINNAGVAVGGPMEDISMEDWRWVVDVNLWGVIHGCHVFYPRMKRQGSGTILNVASAAGLLAPPELGPYNVTKAGVVALSETLHAEGKRHGVQVTVLCPTFFKTRIMEASRGPIDHSSKQLVSKLMERSPLQAADVARHALAACDHGRLYAVPMMDGKLFWVLKRLLPGSFYGLTSMIQQAAKAASRG
jgi:NAD(P)-dependent dehydrogenase (short-subunit alcohol dehydrogenase family)